MSPRLAVTIAAIIAACRSTGTARVVRGHIEIARLGAGHHSAPGDWLMESPSLRVVVAASSAVRPEPPGTVTMVGHHGAHGADDIRSIEPLVVVNHRAALLSDEAMEAVVLRDRPVLRLTARIADSEGAGLSLTREYSFDPLRDALHIVTRVTNNGATVPVSVTCGSRIGWGGADPFAPGLGTITRAVHGEAPWVGIASHGTAVAYTRLRGLLDLAFTDDSHESTRVASFTDVLSSEANLRVGASIQDDATLLVTHGDLSTAARAAADMRAETVQDVLLEVRGAGDETPVVTVSEAVSGHEMLIAEPAAGTEAMPLAPGAYIARVTAAGHASGDPVYFNVNVGHASAPLRLEVPPGGLIRVSAVDASNERDLPVRVVVRGIAPTPDPNLGPNYRGAGAGVVVVVPNGHTEIPVPAGHYKVTVSHGPEWTLAQSDTEVTETLRGEVTARLSHAVPMEGWIACDLHVHARPSFDSRVSIEDRVASLVAEGIGFATPTEHNVVGDYSAGVTALPPNVTTPLLWVPAVEVTTDRSAQPWGHFNVYPYRPTPSLPGGGPPPFLNSTPRAIFHAARANNPDVVIQVNHPRMQPNIGYFNTTGLDTRTNRAVSPEYDPNYDAIEVFNGFYIGHIEYVQRGLNDWYDLLNTGARYVATGSSDSHQISYQWAGYPRTYVALPSGEANGVSTELADTTTVLRSLRAGHAFVSSGPMLFLSEGSHGPGDVHPLAARESLNFRVRVEAAPWIDVQSVDLVVDGQRVRTIAVPTSTELLRLDTTVALYINPGSWVVATAIGARDNLEQTLPNSHGQPFAFTNPIFFDAAPAARP